MGFDYSGRVGRLQQSMSDLGVDVVLLSVGADLPYFTGYQAVPSERLTVLVMRAEGEPVLLVPRLEAPRVETGHFELRSWSETDDPLEIAASVGGPLSSVAVDDHMWSVFLVGFQKHWPHASWRPASDLTRDLRMRKDTAEIDALRRAAHAVDRVMEQIPEKVAFEGRTERDVARDLAEMTAAEGHQAAQFTIVAAGRNGASPHHEPGESLIEAGDLVVCDFGGRWDGYCSDSTRTFSVGEPSSEQVEVHGIVQSANEAGRAAVAPGVACQDVDRAARRIIEDAGYGEDFIHRTGHGIGLEVHEHPYLVEGNRLSLEPGMTFSIEPGIYLPGRFGVRIEDIVACSHDGIEELNRAERGLVVLG